MDPTPATPPIDAYVQEWHAIIEWMEVAKKREMELRQYIAATMFPKEPTGVFKEGTSHATLETPGQYNYRGKLTSQCKREILEEVMEATLAEANLTGGERAALVKLNPELRVKAYKELPPDKRAIVDKMIVTKQGSIKLELDPISKT